LQHDEITAEFRESFAVSHVPLISTTAISLHRMGDFLTLIITVAEMFSADPSHYLLAYGVVVFPDLICLEVQKL
jgi:hypothetical protein